VSTLKISHKASWIGHKIDQIDKRGLDGSLLESKYLTNLESKMIWTVRWGAWMEEDLSIYPMKCKNCGHEQTTEHVLTNCNIFTEMIKKEIKSIIKIDVQIVEHDQITKNMNQISMRGTLSQKLGEKIQEYQYLMILKIISKYLIFIRFHKRNSNNGLRPILPRVTLVDINQRSHSSNNVVKDIRS